MTRHVLGWCDDEACDRSTDDNGVEGLERLEFDCMMKRLREQSSLEREVTRVGKRWIRCE